MTAQDVDQDHDGNNIYGNTSHRTEEEKVMIVQRRSSGRTEIAEVAWLLKESQKGDVSRGRKGHSNNAL